MLLQIQDGATALTLRGGMQKMAAEGMPILVESVCFVSSLSVHAHQSTMTVQAQSRPTSGAMA